MSIYEIGKEKQIDGVWGRELAGRFYTHVASGTDLCRHLSVNQNECKNDYYALLTDVVAFYEVVITHKSFALMQYTPKHIKDLENLKPMDVVWVKIESSRGALWGSTRFLEKCSDGGYLTGDLFNSDGYIDGLHTSSHKVVYLRPPFDI